MNNWEIILYTNISGDCPVDTFIKSIKDAKLLAKVLRDIDLLESYGKDLRGNYTKVIINKRRGTLHELRSKQSSNIVRVFYYFRGGNKIILLNGFIKKSNKTPRNEIKKAYSYMKDWEDRQDGKDI